MAVWGIFRYDTEYMALEILRNIHLAPFTTMRVGGDTQYFARVQSVEELKEALLFAQNQGIPFFILGGGSNVVVSDAGYAGLVIKNEIKGISCADDVVTAGAGEVWDEVVREASSRNLWGIENLSLVPGTVGGAVVQNIGAYGVEACDTILSVEVFDVETMSTKNFLQEECFFGYRESIFKKNKNFIVTHVSFLLSQEKKVRIDYEDVKKFFEERTKNKMRQECVDDEPSLQEIREAIVAIRTAKMPVYPIGTAGSFFKNPVISAESYEILKKTYPEIKAYIQADTTVKLAAAWLFDKVGGWRGMRRGDAGVHEKQALILVNYGRASAEEIFLLAEEMKRDIKEKTNVDIEEEVVVMK